MEEKIAKTNQKEKKEEEEKFESILLELRRVTHVRAGGKKLRFRAVVICGNKKGKVGLGKDSATDASFAIEKATRKAIKNLIEIPIVNGTILHEVSAKYQASKVLLKPQKRGRGLVAGGAVRVICRLAGIKDICAKILGKSKNKITNAMATLKALQKLKKPKNANSSTQEN
jgi:small subunit ribosomal protein S5